MSAASEREEEEEVRVLPYRSTRGKRRANSSSDDEEGEFWRAQAWDEDDPEDEEWDDVASVSDEFDSDFFESESEEADADQEEAAAAAAQRELLRKDKNKRKHFDYEKITRLRQRRLANSTRVWSFLENERVGPKGRRITQDFMMKEALRHEKVTAAKVAERTLLETQQSGAEKPAKPPPTSGNVSVFFSWSSEKTIPYEEARKTPEQRAAELRRGPYERQLYLFSNLAKPKESSFPEIYSALDTRAVELQRTLNPQNAGVRAGYLDPITLTAYNTKAEFAALREASRGEDYHDLVTAALALLPRTKPFRTSSNG